MGNVRNYTTKQILDRVKSHAKGFTHYPSGWWMVYIRSEENEFDKFDDKRYLFQGKICKQVASCTTNAGSYGLRKFSEYNKLGCAVLTPEVIVYDSHIKGMHKGKIESWVQVKGFPYTRDNDMDEMAENYGTVYNNVIGANLHPSSYIKRRKGKTLLIGSWSTACLVDDDSEAFEKSLELTGDQKEMTVVLLSEW